MTSPSLLPDRLEKSINIIKLKFRSENGLFEINPKVSNLAWGLLKQYGEELCFGTTDLDFEYVYTIQYLKLTEE